MENKEIIPSESETITSNWEIIKPIYYTLVDAIKQEKSKGLPLEDESYYLFYQILLDGWKRIYVDVVLNPIKNTITDLFKQALTTEFTLEDPSKVNPVKVYCVYYYILQYFSIGMQPFHEHKDFPDISTNLDEVGDINLDLYALFEELWDEFELEDETGDGLFYDRSEFYEVEEKYLQTFLSECWIDAKKQTQVKALGILDEATACGETFCLDENKLLEECSKEIQALVEY